MYPGTCRLSLPLCITFLLFPYSMHVNHLRLCEELLLYGIPQCVAPETPSFQPETLRPTFAVALVLGLPVTLGC